MLLHMLAHTGSTHGAYERAVAQVASPQTSALEAERIAVYVLAGLCGLLVAGVIACVKAVRRERAERRLLEAQIRERSASAALTALARSITARAA